MLIYYKDETGAELLSLTRILVVDDHERWREQVRLLLQARPGWQVIAEASDGSEAVEKAEELKPDLILLDIGLPKVNGIEAARRIRRFSPSSTIVFLSQQHDLDVVRTGLGTGASGYVLKTDAGAELLPAIDAVLRGKQFVSSSLKRAETAGISAAKLPCRHDLLLFTDDAVLLDSFSRFIAPALKTGNAAIALVTKSHAKNLCQRLKAESVDIDDAIRQGTFILLDLAETLDTLSVDGVPATVRLAEDFSRLIETASKAAKAEHPRVAICGECAGHLWAEGETDLAIRLEQGCNDLAKKYDLDILCSYPVAGFYGKKNEHIIHSIHREHPAV